MIARANGVSQRGRVSVCSSLRVVSRSYWKVSMRAETSKPVATRNQPTPPMQPINM